MARELDREDLAFRSTLAEAARNENAVDAFKIGRRVLTLENLAFDPFELDLDAIGDAAVHERFHQGFVGVLEAGVLADDGDRHLALGLRDAARNASQRDKSGFGAPVMPKAASTSRSSPSR